MAFQNDGSEELCDAAWRGGVGGDTVKVTKGEEEQKDLGFAGQKGI